MSFAQKLKVYSWSKKGWAGREEIDPTYNSPRRRMPYDKVEFDTNRNGSVEFVLDAQEEIQTGRHMEVIDSLSQADRQIYQAPDAWYFRNGRLCKIIDPITQVYEYGEWGSDCADADPEVSKKTAVRTYLEDVGLLPPTANINGFLVDETHEDYSEYVDINMLEAFDFAKDVSDDEEVHTSAITSLIPALSPEVEAQVIALREQCYEDIKNLAVDNINSRIAQFEKDTEKLVAPYLGMNYLSIGYNAPAVRFVKIFTDTEPDQVSCARERKRLFSDLVAEANDISSKNALYGPLLEDGTRNFGKGFVGRIAGMYQHDREICKAWSVNDIRDDKGVVIEESVFSKHRKAFIQEARERGLDEETLRATLWNWFDRKQQSFLPEYDEDGVLDSKGANYKDSIWLQKRAEALKDLFLTRAQWNHIYAIISIAKDRFKLQTNPNKEQEEAVAKLKEHIGGIKTLPDLERYKRWASYRRPVSIQVNGKKVPTLEFEKSLLDCISFKKEFMWWRALVKKEKELKNLKRMSRLAYSKALHIVPTQKKEVTIYCNCDSPVIQKPYFAALKHGKGKYFVKCECGEIHWLDTDSVKDFQKLESYQRS